MTSTALPPRVAAIQRTITTSSADSSSESSAAVSPIDSPRPSASSTSLSSLDSIEVLASRLSQQPLVDSNGKAFELPDISIKDIHHAIPKHCFERSGLRGLGYVARDISSMILTFLLFKHLVTPENIPSIAVRTVLWAFYTFVQGLFGTGLWVLAHECGHQSFSSSKTFNDTVGWICHSMLLVPYFSWKISHGKHHKSTGHMERDMVFVPKTKEEYASRIGHMVDELAGLTEETPIATAIHLIIQQLGGWPAYLLANVTGHNYHERQREGRGKGKHNGWGGGVNHFDPASPLYENKDARLILLSDLGLLIMASVLLYLGSHHGYLNLLVWYGIPYLWVNHWLVAITFLQHTDPSLPHYDAETWTFVRGAAATIDREFGFIGRTLFHGIIETHVLHHFVSVIPFYHADEASDAIKPVLGIHYRSNTEGGPLGFLKALWTTCRNCQWVEPSENDRHQGVLFFRNRNIASSRP